MSHIGSVDVDHHVAVDPSSDNQSVLDVTDDSLDPQTLKRLQSEDPTLCAVRKLILNSVVGVPNSHNWTPSDHQSLAASCS